MISGSFQLEKGLVLHVAVGQKSGNYSGGSGGTFVIKQEQAGLLTPLVIAGGAGGAIQAQKNPWCDAQLEQYGNGPSNNNNNNLGSSGCGKNSGAGFTSNHLQPDGYPKCFKHGMTGGQLSSQKYNFLIKRWRLN